MIVTAVLVITYGASAETVDISECASAYNQLNPDATFGDFMAQFETEDCEFESWGSGGCSISNSTAEIEAEGDLGSAYGYDVGENCTPYCDNNYQESKPEPITVELSAEASKEIGREWSIGGSVEGSPGWLTSMIVKGKATVEASWGGSSSETCIVSKKVQVTLPACKWQKIYTRLDFKEGRKVSAKVDLIATASTTCGDRSVTIAQVTTTLTGDICLGEGASGTESAGTCPPNPPAS